VSRITPIQITISTREGYDKHSWLAEADRHLLSAKTLRQIRKRRRAAVNRARPNERLQHILMMDAAVHSSTLLLAYAFELLLKAGLTRLYIGCSKGLFEHDFMRRFSHKLGTIAKEIEYPLSPSDTNLLRKLQEVITKTGRYPFLSPDQHRHIASQNSRALEFWSDTRFHEMLTLFTSLRKHVLSLDGDSNNPASFRHYGIDSDGYFAFRCGGNLSPRIVVRYSTLQRQQRMNNRRALRRLICASVNGLPFGRVWHVAKYRCVKL